MMPSLQYESTQHRFQMIPILKKGNGDDPIIVI